MILTMYGFQDAEIAWYKSYLHGRQQLDVLQQETYKCLDTNKTPDILIRSAA